jgi:hypothetical protein
MVRSVAEDSRFRAFAGVAGVYTDNAKTKAMMGDAYQATIDRSRAAERKCRETGEAGDHVVRGPYELLCLVVVLDNEHGDGRLAERLVTRLKIVVSPGTDDCLWGAACTGSRPSPSSRRTRAHVRLTGSILPTTKRTNFSCRRCGVSYETALPSSRGRWTDRCEFCGARLAPQGARDRAASTSLLPGRAKLLRG